MEPRKGARTSERAEILRSPITAGGFGRPLTRVECQDLRQLGWHVSQRSIVVRQVSDIASLGIIYSPCRTGGYSHAGIYVTLK